MIDLSLPIDQHALAEGRRILTLLPTTSQPITRLYLHWSVGTYNETFTDYNLMSVINGDEFIGLVTHNPEDNAVGSPHMGSHTAGRNTGALGIAVAAMYGATEHDFGSYGMTQHQINVFNSITAAAAKKYGVDVNGVTHDGEPLIITHAEVAMFDSYFPGDPVVAGKSESGPPYRWDLARVNPSADPLSKREALLTGDQLRMAIRQYKINL